MFRTILLLTLCLCIKSHASILDVFPYSNTNRPEVWQDQLGGFATGGSIHARVPATNLKLLHVDLPYLKGGCGGIDLFGGGFGYINVDQFEKLIRNIGTSALSYSVMLTIKSLSGVVSDLLENLEATARFINSQNINSCQMGASIAAGMFPKTQASQDLACSARKMGEQDTAGSMVTDFFTARYQCQNSETQKNTEKPDSLLGSEYNLVWKALEKISDQKDKEFLMSLSGTLISKNTNNTQSFEHKSSLIKNAQMLETMIFGSTAGTISVYTCKETQKCLAPEISQTSFTPKQSTVYQVRELLHSIAEKIIQENKGAAFQKLSKKERFLASTTSIPIIKLIALNTANKGHGVKVAVEDYAEAVAFDYVINYFDSLLDLVYVALANLEHSQIDGENIKTFKDEIRHLKQMLYFERSKAFERLNTVLSVKMRAQAIEKTVLSHFIEYRS